MREVLFIEQEAPFDFMSRSEGKPKMVRTDPASAGDLDLRQSKNEQKNQKKKAVLRIICKQPDKSLAKD